MFRNLQRSYGGVKLTLAAGARASVLLWRSASSASSSAAGCAPALSALLTMLCAFASCPAVATLDGLWAPTHDVTNHATYVPHSMCRNTQTCAVLQRRPLSVQVRAPVAYVLALQHFERLTCVILASLPGYMQVDMMVPCVVP